MTDRSEMLVKNAFRKFCKNTNLGGYKYMFEEKKAFGRYFWVFINFVLFVTTIFLVSGLWSEFAVDPTVTSLHSNDYSVENVPFPGISICSSNKISKRRAIALAAIIRAYNHNETEEEVLENIKLLGHLIDLDYPNADNLYKFQIQFQNIQREYYKEILHPKQIFRNLSIPCQDLLEECSFGGKKFNCSSKFQLRVTYEGYCCTFNYVKAFNSFDMGNQSRIRPVEFQRFGLRNGLSLVINNDVEDYFFSVHEFAGVGVHVFHPDDYPDILSGSFTSKLVKIGSESFLDISPMLFRAAEAVRIFPPSKRQCIFPEETTTSLGEYSESDCLVECRAISMLALCRCFPFMIPSSDINKICFLSDIPCLNQYTGKWSSLAPQDFFDDDLDRESHDGLRCRTRCWSSCDSTSYRVSANAIELPKHLENKSIVHIYYGKPTMNVYKQDAIYYWFEALSIIGGTFGLTMGFSFIVIIEYLIIFLKLRFGWGNE